MNNYHLKCKDLGFEQCDFTAVGNSETEIIRKFYFHSVINHELELKQMAEEQKAKLHELIREIIDNQN